jgi:osmotically-inducible protein OsmY
MKKTDLQLQQEILDEVSWDTRLDATEIGVTVHAGVVTLTGIVGSWAKKLAAAEAAHRVAGVLDVANDVTVLLGGTTEQSDGALAAAIRQALQWDVRVPDELIASTVSNGFVALEGEVENFAQKDDAARAIGNIAGVVAIDNRIIVRPPEVTPDELRQEIQRALERRIEKDLHMIKLDVEGSRVVLRGDVHSWWEREAIVKAVTETRGVQAVEDRMRFA